MSGHSHWSTIKRQKQAADQKRGRVLGKIAREIQLAAGQGADPKLNPKLKVVLERAKKLNMPVSSIKRAIAKGSGAGGAGDKLLELTLEGYGPEGVAILLKAATDNKNRTLAQIRHLLSKYNGSLGEPGSTAFIFKDHPEKPSFTISVTETKKRSQVLELLHKLREHDDVLGVWSNLAN